MPKPKELKIPPYLNSQMDDHIIDISLQQFLKDIGMKKTTAAKVTETISCFVTTLRTRQTNKHDDAINQYLLPASKINLDRLGKVAKQIFDLPSDKVEVVSFYQPVPCPSWMTNEVYSEFAPVAREIVLRSLCPCLAIDDFEFVMKDISIPTALKRQLKTISRPELLDKKKYLYYSLAVRDMLLGRILQSQPATEEISILYRKWVHDTTNSKGLFLHQLCCGCATLRHIEITLGINLYTNFGFCLDAMICNYISASYQNDTQAELIGEFIGFLAQCWPLGMTIKPEGRLIVLTA